MDGARGLFGDLSFTLSWLFSFLHVCNAGFIARLAGHFVGDMKRRILALWWWDPASLGRSQDCKHETTKQQMDSRISSQYALGSVWVVAMTCLQWIFPRVVVTVVLQLGDPCLSWHAIKVDPSSHLIHARHWRLEIACSWLIVIKSLFVS